MISSRTLPLNAQFVREHGERLWGTGEDACDKEEQGGMSWKVKRKRRKEGGGKVDLGDKLIRLPFLSLTRHQCKGSQPGCDVIRPTQKGSWEMTAMLELVLS